MTKKFLVVREQSGGCDYTIGCGVAVKLFEAESIEGLLVSMRIDAIHGRDPGDVYGITLEGERRLSRATVYEIADQRAVPLEQWLGALHAEASKRFKAEVEANERAELERLQKKYGKQS